MIDETSSGPFNYQPDGQTEYGTDRRDGCLDSVKTIERGKGEERLESWFIGRMVERQSTVSNEGIEMPIKHVIEIERPQHRETNR